MHDGNLFIPTMTWRTVTPEHPDWDELETPSHTGVLTEIFVHAARKCAAFIPHSSPDLARRTHASRHHVDDTVSATARMGYCCAVWTIFMVRVGLRQ
jgi:aminoglycoside 3-N-acetyltransferase